MTITPTVKLLGESSNIFYIIGACRKAAYKAGWTRDEFSKFLKEVTSGDYDNTLSVVMKYFEVE